MKKFLLSFLLITSFIAYSYHQRNDEESRPIVVPPSLINTPTPSDSSAQTGGTQPSQMPMQMQNNMMARYKDGTYTGDVADAFYGNIQVQAFIQNGKIVDVKFLQYPNDRGTSIEINRQADPMLTQEAIQKQSANVDIISGATASSEAFIQSLGSALSKAKI